MHGARTQRISDHIVEIISDSGEGAQTAGQMFGTVSAKMGNGVWTVEIIPAEIEPPARSISSPASTARGFAAATIWRLARASAEAARAAPPAPAATEKARSRMSANWSGAA